MSWWIRGLIVFAVLAAIAGAFYWTYNQGYGKGHNESAVAIATYQGRLSEMQRQLAQRTAQINERVITNYVTRRETIREVTYRNRDVIRNVVPEQFQLSQGWVYAHNQTVQVLPIDFSLAAITTPSRVTDRAALDTIAENYRIANENRNQVLAWQAWYRQQRESHAQANRDGGSPTSGNELPERTEPTRPQN